jgi:methyltransferase family protein
MTLRPMVPYRLLNRFGFDLVRRNYYSPIPDLDRLPADTWDRPRRLPGVRIDLLAMIALLQELGPFMTEAPRGDSMYGGLDAALLYAMIRHFRPERVLEVGSGMSTRITAAALQANDAGHLVAADPYVPQPVESDRVEYHNWPAEEIPLKQFTMLSASDVLFVDTTHTVKIGSEVNRLVLEVLPQLQPGVIVHFHDVYTPWEYPRYVPEVQRGFWAEQYLLEALLTENPRYEVIFASYAVTMNSPDTVRSFCAEPGNPGSFWLRVQG